jgi:hypothetical protein
LTRQINGLRNRDIRALLFRKASPSKAERQRQAAAVSRKLCLLPAHHLMIGKVRIRTAIISPRRDVSSSPS